MKNLVLFVAVFLLLAGCSRGPSHLKIPSLIGNNMLIQQKTEVAFWGKAANGEVITVAPSWSAAVKVKSGEDNSWKVTVPSPDAGGPYSVVISAHDTSVTVNNILCGDVWFCSGQSNMEMPMEGWPPNDTIMHSAATIAAAAIPDIRLFILQRRVSGEPLDDCTGKWEICSPETVRQFSATGFFFGRKIHDEIRQPVGLIESSWGGTPSEAWTSPDALEKNGEFVSELKALKESAPLVASYQTWLGSHKQQATGTDENRWKNLDFGDKAVPSDSFNDSAWKVMTLPGYFESVTGDFDGAVWFRRKVYLPGTFVGKDLVLSLGPVDDMDCTWFNGEVVGATEMSGAWQAERNYKIPGKLVKKGPNVIAVRVMDTGGGGGLYGKKGSMKISVPGSNLGPVDIEGEWKLQPVAELTDGKFYLFDPVNNDFFAQKRPVSLGPGSPASLYNGMVSPAKNYKIRGAIWYQGEANVGRADQYAKIFPLMITDWRDTWKEGDFPFYFVQIAPYIYSGADSTELAPLREAQKKALALPATGMVVTLDIATVNNIHPPFKKEVGERLANIALVNEYGKKIAVNGPEFKSVIRDGITLKITFDRISGGLKASKGMPGSFEIASKKMKFLKATAKIVKDEVWVSNPILKDPVYVRYCWRNGDVATLFNSDGLPAEQFSAGVNK